MAARQSLDGCCPGSGDFLSSMRFEYLLTSRMRSKQVMKAYRSTHFLLATPYRFLTHRGIPLSEMVLHG